MDPSSKRTLRTLTILLATMLSMGSVTTKNRLKITKTTPQEPVRLSSQFTSSNMDSSRKTIVKIKRESEIMPEQNQIDLTQPDKQQASIGLAIKPDVTRVNPGTIINLQLYIVNNGKLPLTNVSISNTSLGLDNYQMGPFGVLEGKTFVIRYNISENFTERTFQGTFLVDAITKSEYRYDKTIHYSIQVVQPDIERIEEPIRNSTPISDAEKNNAANC